MQIKTGIALCTFSLISCHVVAVSDGGSYTGLIRITVPMNMLDYDYNCTHQFTIALLDHKIARILSIFLNIFD